MNKCIYSDRLKCKSCSVVFHKECKKFITAHAHSLAREIVPFVYNSKINLKGSITWSKDINKAKSAALKYALKYNAPIKRYTLSQVISIALINEPVESRVVFIDISTKPQGSLEKVLGVLTSFIDGLLLHNAYVSVYVSSNIHGITLDYNKI